MLKVDVGHFESIQESFSIAFNSMDWLRHLFDMGSCVDHLKRKVLLILKMIYTQKIYDMWSIDSSILEMAYTRNKTMQHIINDS